MASAPPVAAAHGAPERHPRGLYVLFATEMWERFSFYTMLALFTLYLQDAAEGFGWTAAEATTVRANYLLFVFFSPLIGGWLADRKLGYRRAIMIGGFFFIAGHILLAVRSVPVMYSALLCLVVGNGLFKPNVSTIVGNLYPKGGATCATALTTSSTWVSTWARRSARSPSSSSARGTASIPPSP
jgi:POT family proton-dependent oligopeptide transporter